jgi:hypothetical protein
MQQAIVCRECMNVLALSMLVGRIHTHKHPHFYKPVMLTYGVRCIYVRAIDVFKLRHVSVYRSLGGMAGSMISVFKLNRRVKLTLLRLTLRGSRKSALWGRC